MSYVLLSNDDGVHAPGLRALADAFLAEGWRVSVCAPDQERSAAAHSITIKRPVVAWRAAWVGLPAGAPVDVWATDGTPADCVKIALHELCSARPDLVVSGINNGWNIGTDIHYSGTVGAAMEAAFEGVKGMAVSAKRPDGARYRRAASLAALCAARMLKTPPPSHSVLNLNVPDCAPEEIKGLAEAAMTRIRYTDAYDRLGGVRDRAAFWLKGDIVEEGCLPDGDLDMLLKGYATLTLVGWDLSVSGGCAAYL